MKKKINEDDIRKEIKEEQGNDFPGYPKYPDKEDITSRAAHEKKVNRNLDEVSAEDAELTEENELPQNEKQQKDRRQRKGDDLRQDKSRETPVFEEGDDLDVPGSELDDANEDIGEEDEENNYYSLGGDRHD